MLKIYDKMKKLILIVSCVAATNICYSQVSYHSKVIEDKPYVPPVDLDLMRVVLAQKQNAYNNSYTVIQTKFNSVRNLLKYVSDLNKNLVTKQYNDLVGIANSYDLSDIRVINFLNNKLDYLETTIGFLIKYPTEKLADNYFID